MKKKKFKKLKKKYEELKWEKTCAIAYLFNITPNNDSIEIQDTLDEQIYLLEKRLRILKGDEI